MPCGRPMRPMTPSLPRSSAMSQPPPVVSRSGGRAAIALKAGKCHLDQQRLFLAMRPLGILGQAARHQALCFPFLTLFVRWIRANCDGLIWASMDVR